MGSHIAGTIFGLAAIGPLYNQVVEFNPINPAEIIGDLAKSWEADFIVFGPVFATPSKLAYGPPQGVQHLAEVVRQVTIPVLGIGGIDLANLSQVLQTGVYGVAMIRAVLAAPDPALAAEQLAQTVSKQVVSG